MIELQQRMEAGDVFLRNSWAYGSSELRWSFLIQSHVPWPLLYWVQRSWDARSHEIIAKQGLSMLCWVIWCFLKFFMSWVLCFNTSADVWSKWLLSCLSLEMIEEIILKRFVLLDCFDNLIKVKNSIKNFKWIHAHEI